MIYEENEIVIGDECLIYMKEFLKRYPQNYNSSQKKSTAFYRTVFIENKKYTSILESVADYYEYPEKEKRRFEIDIQQMRKSNDYRTEKWGEANNYFKSTLKNNPVLQLSEFLNKKKWKKYDFE